MFTEACRPRTAKLVRAQKEKCELIHVVMYVKIDIKSDKT